MKRVCDTPTLSSKMPPKKLANTLLKAMAVVNNDWPLPNLPSLQSN